MAPLNRSHALCCGDNRATLAGGFFVVVIGRAVVLGRWRAWGGSGRGCPAPGLGAEGYGVCAARRRVVISRAVRRSVASRQIAVTALRTARLWAAESRCVGLPYPAGSRSPPGLRSGRRWSAASNDAANGGHEPAGRNVP